MQSNRLFLAFCLGIGWMLLPSLLSSQNNTWTDLESPKAVSTTAVLKVRLQSGWNGNQAMEGGFITLTGPSLRMSVPGAAADFRLDALPAGEYAITGLKDDPRPEGITVLDLIRISRHLMNIEPFEEPWQWVAADADRSNTLDKEDVHLLEDFLLGRNRELPDNEAYRFVDAAHVFPFPYPLEEPLSEIHTLHLDPDRARDQNITLIGIKMGDVDASAKTDVTRPNASLQIAPLALKSGDSCTLTLRMAEGGNWTGIQCALSFDPGKIRLEALQTKELPANIRPMCAQPQAGVLTLGWYDVLPFELQSGQNLVVFRVRALQDVQLADAVRLGEEHLPAEGYDGLFQARTVHLELQEAPDGARGFFEKNGVILNDCFHAEHAARQIANSW